MYGYGPLKRLIKRQKEGIIALKNSSTLLFVTYQIIVELSAVHQFAGGYGYPAPFRQFIDVIELICSLDIFEVLHLDCIVRESDYTYKLYTMTLGPLGLLTLAFAYESARKAFYKQGEILNGKTMTYTLIVLYFILVRFLLFSYSV